MKQTETRFLAAALMALFPTSIFLTIMVSKFWLGIDAIYDAWDSFYMNPDWQAVNTVIELIVVLGPILALLITAARTIRFQIGQENGALISTITFRANRATLAVMIGGLLLTLIVVGYGFVENFRPV